MSQKKSAKNLVVGHCNIQGGLTGLAKPLEIQDLLKNYGMDILSLNETNLKSDIDTSTLHLPHNNYNFIRCDRPTDNGRGGCGILINKNINYKEIKMDLNMGVEKIEALWIELSDYKLYVCGFYRSTNFCPVDVFLDYMAECMSKLNGKKVIWIGDININQNNIRDLSYKKLDMTLRSHHVVQVIQDITRTAYKNGHLSQTTIDVIMTTCYSEFEQSGIYT